MRAILVAFLLGFATIKITDAAELTCGSKIYNLVSPKIWSCCGGRLYPKKSGFFACCNKRCYNPLSQTCCGNDIFPRLNANSACCNGKFYQRGAHSCCNKKVLDLTTHDCCREKPYEMKKAICCEGVVIQKSEAHDRTECCGTSTYDPKFEMCCAEKVVKKTAGRHTRCCEMKTYDSRTNSCCMGKIIPRVEGKDECCNGIMINSTADICCGTDVKARIYDHHTGCCRIGKPMVASTNEKNANENGIHVIYDKSDSVCCSGKLSFKQDGPNTGCCGQESYNVETHICCGDKIHKRHKGITERCCEGKAYDRSNHICCHGTLHALSKKILHYTFCCGTKAYDRRKAQCDANNKLISLQCEDAIRIYPDKNSKIPV